jgi:thiamine-monophosphate kinase
MSISPGSTVADVGEARLIERIRAAAGDAPPWVVVGMGDDAAVVEPARNRSDVITTDAFVEGVHFDRAYVPPTAIGHKALAVNLSDLAAMGAEPRAALLSLVLPPSMLEADFDAMVAAFLSLARVHGVALIGGNIARSPGPLVLDVTAMGVVKPRRVLTRSGARPGDDVYVSGTIGAAFAGFRAASAGHRDVAEGDDGLAACQARFLAPDPRVRLGLLLGRNRVASACVDASDGLADAVRQIAAASGVGMDIEAGAVPVPDAARQWFTREGLDPFEAAVSGGEDYELVFTVPRRRRRALTSVLRLAGGLPCTRIGTVVAGPGLAVTRPGGRAPWPVGFTHFR